ncbi:hypothetical protein L7F22_033426 [Adiantum nelumboides]|nr:hypothetical protein [Adiantum nelumboides]
MARGRWREWAARGCAAHALGCSSGQMRRPLLQQVQISPHARCAHRSEACLDQWSSYHHRPFFTDSYPAWLDDVIQLRERGELEQQPQEKREEPTQHHYCVVHDNSTKVSDLDTDVNPVNVQTASSVPNEESGTTEWIEEVIYMNEQDEVLDSYKGYREAKPGLDDFVYVGDKKKALSDDEIVENICTIIRRWGWGVHAELELGRMAFTPTSQHVIEVLKQFRDVNVLLGFFKWTRQQNWYSPSSAAFTLLMDRIGLAGNFDEMKWLHETMKTDGCAASSVTLNVLVKCYLRASRTDDAHSCFMESIEAKCLPDPFTFNTLIGSCLTNGLPHRAVEVFNSSVELGFAPERHIYEALIPIFVKAGNLEKAHRLFEEMRMKGHQASPSLFACLIDNLGRAGRLESAMKLFTEFKDFGRTPTANMHVSLVESFAKAGKLEMAVKIMGQMQKADHIPPTSLFTCIIDAHLKSRQLEKAMQLLGTMMKLGHLPSRSLYSTFIDAYLKSRELDTAIKLFFSMQDAGVLPTPPVCTLLVQTCATSGDFQMAMRLFQGMHKLGFRHGEGTYALLLPLLMKQPQLDIFTDFLQDMKSNQLPVDGISSNALMGVLQDGHADRGCQCYKLLLSMNIDLNLRVSRQVLELSLNEGMYDVSKLALDRLLQSGFKADLRMYTLTLSCFSRCQCIEKEGLLMSMLGVTGHTAHKFLCGLLSSSDQRKDSALNFVRSYYQDLENHVDEKLARWFTCVLLNYLVLMGQIKRARCVWKVAYERKLFPNRILFDQELVWSLDVRALSIGAALTALVHTLHRFRKRMIHYHSLPRRIKIVTGGTLNDPIIDLLRPLDSPFENHGGALRCRGTYVAQWFTKPIVEKFLENELPSREEIIMQKINMLFPRPKPEPYMLILNAATVV